MSNRTVAARVLMIGTGTTGRQGNRLLQSLHDDDITLLTPHLERVVVGAGETIASTDGDAALVYFPLTLVASVIQVMADGARFEIGLIGAEGVVGWSAALADAPSSLTGVAQMGGGTALVAQSSTVAALCRRSAALNDAMLAFGQSFSVQMSHTIVATLRDGIERRLARWLLMLHDRVDGDVLALTHGELAGALHVRRASITDTLHILEGGRVVRCTRGQLAIRDRAALVAIAGDSYGPAEASYRALIGDFGKR